MAGSIVQTAVNNGNGATTIGVTFSTAPASGNKVILVVGRRGPTTDTNSSFSPAGGVQRGGQAGTTTDNNLRVFEWDADGTSTTYSVTFSASRAFAVAGYEASGLGAYDTAAVSSTVTATSVSSGTTATLANSANFSLSAGCARDQSLTGDATNATLSLLNPTNTGGPTVRLTTTGEWRSSTGSTTGISDTLAWGGSYISCAGVWVWQEAPPAFDGAATPTEAADTASTTGAVTLPSGVPDLLGSVATNVSEGVTSISATHTLLAGSNRRVFAVVGVDDSSSTITTISSVTYGGVSMTRVTDGTDTANYQAIDTSTTRAEIWEILEADLPANGSHTVTATASESVGDALAIAVYAFKDADQSANVAQVQGVSQTTTESFVEIASFAPNTTTRIMISAAMLPWAAPNLTSSPWDTGTVTVLTGTGGAGPGGELYVEWTYGTANTSETIRWDWDDTNVRIAMVTISLAGTTSSRSGSAAATEAADTSSATGDYTPPAVSGTAAVTEAADTSSTTATHTPPAFTGTAAPSEAADTATASGAFVAPVYTGTAAPTEADDTSATTATHTPPAFTGTAAATEAADTSTASGTHTDPIYTGTAAATEAADTSATTGTFVPGTLTGTAAPTEAADTAATTGTHTPPVFAGTAAATEAADTATAAGTHTDPVYTATASPTEADDASTASGTFVSGSVTGTASVTEADDTAAAAGTFTPVYTGSATPSEDSDTGSATGTHVAPTFTGTAAATETADTASASGTYVAGAVSGTGAATEAVDVAAGSGTFVGVYTGTAAASEAVDVAAAAGSAVPLYLDLPDVAGQTAVASLEGESGRSNLEGGSTSGSLAGGTTSRTV